MGKIGIVLPISLNRTDQRELTDITQKGAGEVLGRALEDTSEDLISAR